MDTEEAARALAGKAGLAFLPRGQARGLAGLLSQYGPTIVSAGADEKRSNHVLLKRPHSSALGKAFVAMGFTEQQGYDIARHCGRSLAVLARQRPSGTAERPEWIDSAEPLLPALLADSRVSTGNTDQAILCTLARCAEYEVVEAPLRKLAKLKDPPVDHVGDVWTMRSSVDAFVHLGHLIGPEHLRQFSSAVKEVFSHIPPAPRADEVYRPPSERLDTHSAWLREGMMTMLLHMAVLHEQADFTAQGTTPQEFVNGIVRGLPGLSSDHRLLASLQENLALLAEAAPIPFLEALERLLEGDAAAIKPIFEEHKGFLTPRTYHVGLLWALEILAWDPALLLRSTMCLAHLAAIDPGGSLSNRPINSLRAVFLSWSPNTSARAKQRTAVLSHVVKAVPAIAWPLLTKLLPQSHDTSGPAATPKFREFGDTEEEEVLTYGVVWESQAAVVHLALEHARQKPDRWETLTGAMSEFPPEPLDSMLGALDAVLAEVTGEIRFQIWDVLRKEANRHRSFANTDWALQPDVLSRVDALVEKFKPDDTLLQSAWLFDDWMPAVSGVTDAAEDPMTPIDAARSRAAVAMNLVQSAKLYGHDPWAFLNDVWTRLLTHLNSRIDELLPHNWRPAR
ncbi:transposase domain-containing protein [Cupriavidus sp. CuC1]|uniref:transposase domain-containing protein n=1 Tax=Cupriavidus sp. CuC1 TaxID=3373131 RepID=UPI0037D579B5